MQKNSPKFPHRKRRKCTLIGSMPIFGKIRAKGEALLEVLVGIGLVGSVVVGYSSWVSQSFDAVGKERVRQDLEVLRRYIRENLSCEATMLPAPPVGCSGGPGIYGAIEVKREDGKALISTAGTVVGGIPLRARCSGNRVLLEANTTSDETTATWVDLFKGIPVNCDIGAVPPGCIKVEQFTSSYKNGTNCSFKGKNKAGVKRMQARGLTCYLPAITFKNGGPTYSLRIYTDSVVPRFKFTAKVIEWKSGKVNNIPTNGPLDAAPYYVGASGSLFVYEIPDSDFIQPNSTKVNSALDSEADITIAPVDASNTPLGNACLFRVGLASPLVLDLNPLDKIPDTLSLSDSRVHFDLDGSGQRRKTGWIFPSMGFLVWDRNQNGKIDDGSELFGTAYVATRGGGAENGYIALSEHDTAKKGYIDPSDPIFSKLLVWRDNNMDGISQAGELKTLKEMSITRIGTRFEPLRFNSGESLAFENVFRYRSRFWGPSQCGKVGCRSYDVYFATSISTVSRPRATDKK